MEAATSAQAARIARAIAPPTVSSTGSVEGSCSDGGEDAEVRRKSSSEKVGAERWRERREGEERHGEALARARKRVEEKKQERERGTARSAEDPEEGKLENEEEERRGSGGGRRRMKDG